MAEAKPIHTMSIAELEATFPVEDDCCAYLVARRWPDGVTCPRCGSHDVGRLKSEKWKWRCSACGKGGAYHFSHIAGTALENTKLPLRNWFRLLHLMANSKDEINAVNVRHRLGFSYRTAWTMCQRMDAVLGDTSFRTVIGLPDAEAAYISMTRFELLERAREKRAAPRSLWPEPERVELPIGPG
jgi:hypothetical protein